MFDTRARELQQQAIEALSDLRTWIWGRHAELLPYDLASITREEAERYAAYLDWYSRVEEVILALASTGAPPVSVAPVAAPAAAFAPALPARSTAEELLNAPTVRAPKSFAGAEHGSGWQPILSAAGLAASAELHEPAAGFKAA